MTLIQTLGRQRQADTCEFKANLVYIVSSKTARDTKNKQTNKQTTKNLPSLKNKTDKEKLLPLKLFVQNFKYFRVSRSIFFHF
jgi:cell fate regulator YaaT (PSP1 superfamily)